MWVKGSFYAFMASSAYIFLKRFYFKEILAYFLWIVFSILSFAFTNLSIIYEIIFHKTLGDLLLNYSLESDSIATVGPYIYGNLE